MTSGTVDMPTRSAPSTRAARISAGVSKLGPGEPHVDAFVQLDVRRPRRLVELGDERWVVGLGQRHEAIVGARMPIKRIGAGEIDVVGMATSAGGRHSL